MSVERKPLGRVKPEERDAIQALFERRNALDELLMIVGPEQGSTYERLLADVERTKRAFDEWWRKRAAAYQWTSCAHGSWEIDFSSCEVFLLCGDRPTS